MQVFKVVLTGIFCFFFAHVFSGSNNVYAETDCNYELRFPLPDAEEIELVLVNLTSHTVYLEIEDEQWHCIPVGELLFLSDLRDPMSDLTVHWTAHWKIEASIYANEVNTRANTTEDLYDGSVYEIKDIGWGILRFERAGDLKEMHEEYLDSL